VNKEEIILVYDGECPACCAYTQAVNIRESVGNLRLVDARKNNDVLEEIAAHDMDIDQGMVLKMGEQLYYGADAMHALALIGSRSGLFNRVNYWMFKSKTVSSVLYPVLRSIRNLLLRLRGKSKIGNNRR
jgi:predicted DCC family thiol-disulfide oxidoreductase YuxK